MGKIVELPESLANQIAAGEVVERPASVVKELLENSIDAGATKITVRVEEAGLNLIELADNGAGIEAEDLPIALLRHATSKLKSARDLFQIRTLGFRGEALPSIASISELTIETSTEEETAGTRLIAKAGKVELIEAMAKVVGTKITVKNLFYNTPARLKFIRSLQAELAHITDIINRESLAHPEISFTLISEKNTVLQTTGSGDLRQTIAQIYGLSNARKLVSLSTEDLDFKVSGFISLPELTRASRNYISVFLNGRYIKNFQLNRAIIEGYGSKLMVGRFPLVVLHIEMAPQLVDVNVHPTKQEVRLSKEPELMKLISTAIREALGEETLIPLALENLPQSQTREGVEANFEENNLKNYLPPKMALTNQPITYEAPEEKIPTVQEPEITLETVFESQTETVNAPKVNQTFPELQYLAQLHSSYLLCQAPNEFYIVDQHAAQERVKYEYWRDKIGEVNYEQQSLLFPVLIDLPKDEFQRVLEKKSQLEEAGLYLEEYGEGQFILREHPIWMREAEIEKATYELIDLLLADKETSVKKYREDLAIMIACRSSIKAHDPIDPDGARELLRQLSECENPYNCPHGRPSLVKFDAQDLQKMFRRIMQSHGSARSNMEL
ncbi:MAG: DNA mismatch repair endonuclease MutL [Streptococcaceae bacterium]|jgi:DNA mismatch repair protein MutL|nr:DNA mismatch repair endonuclease MutL [Streptococcaceae bacterium]